MTEFENLKGKYATTIQLGLAANMGYNASKSGNEALHKFCENLIDGSDYSDDAKSAMKSELKLLKEAMSNEIDNRYKRR